MTLQLEFQRTHPLILDTQIPPGYDYDIDYAGQGLWDFCRALEHRVEPWVRENMPQTRRYTTQWHFESEQDLVAFLLKWS